MLYYNYFLRASILEYYGIKRSDYFIRPNQLAQKFVIYDDKTGLKATRCFDYESLN